MVLSHRPTCDSVSVRGHGLGVQVLQLAVQLVQFAAGGLELTIDLGGALPAGDGVPHPLRRLLDPQLLLDLLLQAPAQNLQVLLELRVQDVHLGLVLVLDLLTLRAGSRIKIFYQQTSELKRKKKKG